LYIEKLVKEKNDKIAEKTVDIENIEGENVSDIKELRQIYINQILTKLPNNAIYFSEIKINDLKEEEKFDELIAEGKISYRYQHPNYSNSQNNVSSFDFKAVENEVNSEFTFEERKHFVESKHNDRIEILKKEIEKLKKEKTEIENWDLTQIFREVDINQYLSEFSNNGLLRNLVLEGYINENYNDYISLFHEVSLTVNDKKFERSVKSGVYEHFNYELTHIENLVDNHLELKYFSRDTILNYNLLDFLGEKYSKYSKRYDAIIDLLSNEKERSIEFIDNYIKPKSRS
jgi:hypothetical protein